MSASCTAGLGLPAALKGLLPELPTVDLRGKIELPTELSKMSGQALKLGEASLAEARAVLGVPARNSICSHTCSYCGVSHITFQESRLG